MHTPIGKILQGFAREGGEASIRGWVYRTRTSGGLAFIVVRDSTGVMQCAVKKDAVGEKNFSEATSALVE